MVNTPKSKRQPDVTRTGGSRQPQQMTERRDLGRPDHGDDFGVTTSYPIIQLTTTDGFAISITGRQRVRAAARRYL
jgi:hypothetical protein